VIKLKDIIKKQTGVIRQEAMSRRIAGKTLKIPQPSDFGGDMEKYFKALNKHMKEVEKLAKLQKKNKKNEVIVKEDSSAQYEKLRKNFEKKYKEYWDAVNDFQLALKKQGKKKEEMMIHRKYSKEVLGFHAWMRQWIRKVFF
tara:strand:- start:582 stop:1007 length:426 start_codon:yes stop_codon:yes gene_type:complete